MQAGKTTSTPIARALWLSRDPQVSASWTDTTDRLVEGRPLLGFVKHMADAMEEGQPEAPPTAIPPGRVSWSSSTTTPSFPRFINTPEA